MFHSLLFSSVLWFVSSSVLLALMPITLRTRMSDINDANLSNLKFALLLTCSTAQDYSEAHIINNQPVNIVEQMICSGAETVVCFNEVTLVSDCNHFAEDLMEQMISNCLSVNYAIYEEINFSSPRYQTAILSDEILLENAIIIAGNDDLNLYD